MIWPKNCDSQMVELLNEMFPFFFLPLCMMYLSDDLRSYQSVIPHLVLKSMPHTNRAKQMRHPNRIKSITQTLSNLTSG